MATNEKNNIIDETRLDVSEQNETVAYPVSENESVNTNDKSGVKNVIAGIAGAATGVSAAVLITSFKNPDTDTEPELSMVSDAEHFNGEQTPIARNINNDMSFNDAFAAARKEVGAGGIFSWHGRTYGTYYADEWQEFSDEYKQTFSNYPYDIDHELYLAEAPQPAEAELLSDDLAEAPQPAEAELLSDDLAEALQPDEAELSSDYLAEALQPDEMNIADDYNPEEIQIIPEDEVDMSISNPYPPEIEAQEVTIVNDSDDPENLSIDELDYEVTPIDPIDDLSDIPVVRDSIYDDQDAGIDLSDFNNNADISNFD